jgi:hypothetical protein
LLIYKVVIKPIWSYGIELWGCASKSNIVIMQRSQSKILRAIANAPFFFFFFFFSSSGPGTYVLDALRPVGLLCDPVNPLVFGRSHSRRQLSPRLSRRERSKQLKVELMGGNVIR